MAFSGLLRDSKLRDAGVRAVGVLKVNACFVAVALLVGTLYVWNALTVPFGTGYDEIGHAAYIHSIVLHKALPHPLSGWNTFHPPAYYLASSVIWSVIADLGPKAVVFGIRVLGACAMLISGISAYFVLRCLQYSRGVALVSALMLWTMPFVIFSASWIGNEAFLAGVSSAACLAIVATVAGEGRVGYAFGSGLLCGLAVATKYTGLFTVAGLLISSIDLQGCRVRAKTLVASIIGAAIVVAPVLIRNVSSTGAIFPMTRDLEPIARSEKITHINRSITDYLLPPLKSFTEPTVFSPKTGAVNEHMANVWGLTYASAWHDPFGHRLPPSSQRGLAGLLIFLGLIPTCVTLFGAFSASRDLVRSRLEGRSLPLLAMAISGVAAYVVWTWQSSTLVGVKASYLMPLVVPAAAFFGRGLVGCSAKLRVLLIVGTVVTACVSGVTYTEGLVYNTPLRQHLQIWKQLGEQTPSSDIRETINWWEAQ